MNFFKNKRILLIAPHADDESAGCGGTLLRARKEGAQTYCLVLSVGDLVHYGTQPEMTSGARREKELKKAMETLEITDWEILFTDNQQYMKLDTLPRQELAHLIESKARLSILNIEPHIVLLPHPSSHQDHEAVFKACFTALRPHHPGYHFLPEVVLVYEAPQVCWSLPPFKPNFYVDITPFLASKKKAFLAHKSQQRTHPHPFSWENIERLAYLRGAEAGLESAEAFLALRIRVV